MSVSFAAALLQLVSGTQIDTDDYQFTLYMAQYNKTYASLQEYSLRLIEFSKMNHEIMHFA